MGKARPASQLSRVVRGAGWMKGAQLGRLLVQTATFVLVARTLGAGGLGEFAAALAVVYLLFPFASLGTGNVLIRDTARDAAAFPRALGTAFAATGGTAVALVLVAVAAGSWIVHLPASVVLLLAVSELLFAKLADVSSQAFQAHERPRGSAMIALVVPVLRGLTAAAYFTFAAEPSVRGWAVCYLVCTAAGATYAVGAVLRRLDSPVWPSGRGLLTSVRRGSLFSLALSGAMVSADIDKVMLARLDTLGAVGVYTAAYRATSVALVPITSLFWVTYARFFRHGRAGVLGTIALARRMSPGPVGFGLAAGVVLFAGAPLISQTLGGGFEATAAALRWLAPLPVIAAVVYLATDTLTGSDRQGVCTVLQLAAAALNVALNLLLIPAHSWRGAAWATLISYGALAGGLSLAVLLLARRAVRESASRAALEPGGAS